MKAFLSLFIYKKTFEKRKKKILGKKKIMAKFLLKKSEYHPL